MVPFVSVLKKQANNISRCHLFQINYLAQLWTEKRTTIKTYLLVVRAAFSGISPNACSVKIERRSQLISERGPRKQRTHTHSRETNWNIEINISMFFYTIETSACHCRCVCVWVCGCIGEWQMMTSHCRLSLCQIVSELAHFHSLLTRLANVHNFELTRDH